MRKIVAVFLAIAVITLVFTACDDSGSEITTGMNITTGNITTTTQPSTTAAYVLTTQAGKTVPAQVTTRFETTTIDYNLISMTTGDVDVPDVNISSLSTTGSSLPISVPSTAPPTVPTATTTPTTSRTTTTTTTTKKTTTTTTKVEKFPTALVIDSEGYNATSGKLYLGISPSGWTSDIKAATINISVKIDGMSSSGTVPCSVTAGKNSDGMQEIVIDLSSQSVTSGSTITYTIPEGFLVTKAGNQFNTSYTSSASV